MRIKKNNKETNYRFTKLSLRIKKQRKVKKRGGKRKKLSTLRLGMVNSAYHFQTTFDLINCSTSFKTISIVGRSDGSTRIIFNISWCKSALYLKINKKYNHELQS